MAKDNEIPELKDGTVLQVGDGGDGVAGQEQEIAEEGEEEEEEAAEEPAVSPPPSAPAPPPVTQMPSIFVQIPQVVPATPGRRGPKPSDKRSAPYKDKAAQLIEVGRSPDGKVIAEVPEGMVAVVRSLEDYQASIPWKSGEWFSNLERIEPTMYKGQRCDGTVDTYHHDVTEEEIRERHGKGLFRLSLIGPRRDGRGRQKYRVYSFNNPFGEVKLGQDTVGTPMPTRSVSDSVVEQAFAATQRTSEEMRIESKQATEKLMQKLEEVNVAKEQSTTGQLLEMVKMSNENAKEVMQMQIKLFQESIQQIRAEIVEMRSKGMSDGEIISALRPATSEPSMDYMKLIEMQDKKHQQALEIMREEAKLRAEQDRANATLREETSKRETDRLLGLMQQSHQQQMEMMTRSHEAQVSAVNSQVSLYRNEMDRISTKIQNPPDLTEKLKEYRDLRTVVRDIAGVEEAGGLAAPVAKEESWEEGVERVTKFLENPIAAAVIGKVFGIEPGAPAMPPGYSPPAIPAQVQAQAQAQPNAVRLTPENKVQMATALGIIENSIRQGITPEDTAGTLLTQVDHSLLQHFTLASVDAIIQAVELAGQTESPILTVGGKQFTKQLCRIMVNELARGKA